MSIETMSAESKELTKHNETSLDGDSRRPLIVPGDVEYMAVLILATGLNILPSAMRSGAIYQLSRAVSALWYKSNRGAIRRVRHHLQVLFKYDSEDVVNSELVVFITPSIVDDPVLTDTEESHLDTIDRETCVPKCPSSKVDRCSPSVE